MTHQLALTVITPIKPGELANLKQLLGTIPKNRTQPSLIPFEKLANLHFARFFITDFSETVQDLEGNPIRPSLVFETTIDAPLSQHLQDLVAVGATGLDQIYHYCEGYPPTPTPASRLAYLQAHSIAIASKPFYVNTPGRTVQQIHQEAQLREAISAFLNSQDWSSRDALTVRAAIQTFVFSQPNLVGQSRPLSLLNSPGGCKKLFIKLRCPCWC
jgi:hypothetical protein